MSSIDTNIDINKRISFEVAQKYAENMISFEKQTTPDGFGWTEKNPVIQDIVPVFRKSDEIPDFYLYTVFCDGSPCGFILEEIDGELPRIVYSSFSGSAPIKIEANRKIYWTSYVDWYSVPNTLQDDDIVFIADKTRPNLTVKEFKERITTLREKWGKNKNQRKRKYIDYNDLLRQLDEERNTK